MRDNVALRMAQELACGICQRLARVNIENQLSSSELQSFAGEWIDDRLAAVVILAVGDEVVVDIVQFHHARRRIVCRITQGCGVYGDFVGSGVVNVFAWEESACDAGNHDLQAHIIDGCAGAECECQRRRVCRVGEEFIASVILRASANHLVHRAEEGVENHDVARVVRAVVEIERIETGRGLDRVRHTIDDRGRHSRHEEQDWIGGWRRRAVAVCVVIQQAVCGAERLRRILGEMHRVLDNVAAFVENDNERSESAGVIVNNLGKLRDGVGSVGDRDGCVRTPQAGRDAREFGRAQEFHDPWIRNSSGSGHLHTTGVRDVRERRQCVADDRGARIERKRRSREAADRQTDRAAGRARHHIRRTDCIDVNERRVAEQLAEVRVRGGYVDDRLLDVCITVEEHAICDSGKRAGFDRHVAAGRREQLGAHDGAGECDEVDNPRVGKGSGTRDIDAVDIRNIAQRGERRFDGRGRRVERNCRSRLAGE